MRLVGVVYRADTLTGTPVLCQRCVTWAWRTKPSRRLSDQLLAGNPPQPVRHIHKLPSCDLRMLLSRPRFQAEVGVL